MKDIYEAVKGVSKGYWGVRWAIYNIAFVLVGRTFLWSSLGKRIW